MRVLLATHYWLPHPGGVEFEALEQARRLTRRGHRVTAVSSRLAGDPSYSNDEGFELYRVRAANVLERRFGVPYPLFHPGLFGLMSRLAGQCDVVLAHSHTFMSTIAAARAARAQRRPFVLIQNNPYIEYAFPLNVVQDAADVLLGKPAMRAADRLLAISHFTAAYCRRLVPGKPVEVLYLGTDTSRFTPITAAERSALRERLGLPAGRFIALTVRRLFYRNGVDILMRACPLLQADPDVHVVVGGKGPDRAAMESYIGQNGLANVTLAGYIPDDRLADYFRAADVFVLPTRTAEGFGLAMMEAAACGVPTIATRSGAPEELIRDGVTGILVQRESPEALASAILALKAQAERTRQMGAAAREFAETLDWERSIDRLEAILLNAHE